MLLREGFAAWSSDDVPIRAFFVGAGVAGAFTVNRSQSAILPPRQVAEGFAERCKRLLPAGIESEPAGDGHSAPDCGNHSFGPLRASQGAWHLCSMFFLRLPLFFLTHVKTVAGTCVLLMSLQAIPRSSRPGQSLLGTVSYRLPLGGRL